MQENADMASGCVCTHSLPPSWFRTASIGDIMDTIASYRNTTTDLLLASQIKYVISENTPTSRLLQYCIDIASDQFLAEEFYQRYPNLLVWLSESGTTEEEVVLRAYVKKNPQIFRCRVPECDGSIVGACPGMYCEKCGTRYMLYLDGVTETICNRCVANDLGECTDKTRRVRKGIYGIV